MVKPAVSIWILLAVFLFACTSEPETPEVIFDEDGCTYSGPSELTTGDHSFVFKDLSDQNQELWSGQITGGHTYQDLLDLQSEPGEYIPKPNWLYHPRLLSQEMDESVGAEVYTWRFVMEGDYELTAGTYSPPSVWICGSFQVVAAPDE